MTRRHANQDWNQVSWNNYDRILMIVSIDYWEWLDVIYLRVLLKEVFVNYTDLVTASSTRNQLIRRRSWRVLSELKGFDSSYRRTFRLFKLFCFVHELTEWYISIVSTLRHFFNDALLRLVLCRERDSVLIEVWVRFWWRFDKIPFQNTSFHDNLDMFCSS